MSIPNTAPTPITLIPGDGIGPEVVEAARRLIDATGVRIAWEEAHAGASVFRKGIASGVPQETLDSISRTRLVLKGPLETPVGFGEQSANVTLRKLFETYGNIQPVRELPGVPTPYAGRGIDPSSCARTSRTSTRASSTCRPTAWPSASSSSPARAARKSAGWPSRWRGPKGARRSTARPRQHHEDDRGPAEADLRGDRPGVPRPQRPAHHRGQLRPPTGAPARAVLGDRHDQHERGHPLRPHVGAGRRAGLRPVGQHRAGGGPLRWRSTAPRPSTPART